MANREIEAVLKVSAKRGNMSALNDVSGKLRQVTNQAEAFNRANLGAIARVQQQMARYQPYIDRVQSSMASINRYGGAAMAVAGYGGVQAVRQFAGVERQLTRTGLVLNATRDDMKTLYRDIGNAAKTYALSSGAVVETVAAYAAAGAELKDIRSDLDILAKAQQAIDATGSDTVNTWDAARKSLKLTGDQAQRFFEIVAAGGAAGKFEARDMAAELPTVLPIAARLGISGLEGAERLVGVLEAMADFTGQPSEAATSISDFLEKISSPDVEKRFGEAGIDLRKRLKDARDAGEDLFEVMRDMLKLATGGDATRLGEFFGDKEARRAADLILNQYDRIIEAQNKVRANAPGILDRNVNAVLADAQTKLDALSESYTRLKTAAGETLVELGVSASMDAVATDLDRFLAARKAGWTPADSLLALLTGGDPSDVVDEFASRGGLRTPREIALTKAHYQHAAERAKSAAAAAGYVDGEALPTRPHDKSGMPVEGPIPTSRASGLAEQTLPPDREMDNRGGLPMPTSRPSDYEIEVERQDAMRMQRLGEDRNVATSGLRWLQANLDAVREAGERPRPHVNAIAGLEAGAEPTFDQERFRKEFLTRADNQAAIDWSAIPGAIAGGIATVGADLVRPIGESSDRMQDRARTAQAGDGGVFAEMLTGMERLLESARPLPPFAERAASVQDVDAGFLDMLEGVDKLGPAGEQAGRAVEDGGTAAGQSIRDAALAINQAGSDAGSAFARMLDGIAEGFGAKAAASFRANVGTVTVKTQAAPPQIHVSGNKGRTMVNAGKTVDQWK